MKIGYDLDGTLDRPAVKELLLEHLKGGHEIHIISGVFPEAGDWNQGPAKRKKLDRLGIPWRLPENTKYHPDEGHATLHVLNAIPATFTRDERLADLGLRKGALCEELGITLFFDDSSVYCEMIPKMSGNTVVLKVGEGR